MKRRNQVSVKSKGRFKIGKTYALVVDECGTRRMWIGRLKSYAGGWTPSSYVFELEDGKKVVFRLHRDGKVYQADSGEKAAGGEILISSKETTARNPAACPSGQIRRKAYKRKGYTRADGTRVAATRVPSDCITDRGAPGRGPKVIKITREGKLGGPGYLDRSASARHKILDGCVKKYGYRSCLGSIQALAVLGKREMAKADRDKIAADRNYLVKKYGGPGSVGPRKPKRKLNPEEEAATLKRLMK